MQLVPNLQIDTHQKRQQGFFKNSNNNKTKQNLDFISKHKSLNPEINCIKHQEITDKKARLILKGQNDKLILRKINQKLLCYTNIEDYIQSFFTLDYFKNFHTIHLIIHEKGQSNAKHLEVMEYGARTSFKEIKEFNELFLGIKKSKNRSFGQSNLKGLNFEILGTFIAREFSLRKHNIIFLLSKDEFLPQAHQDISIFNYICAVLPEQLNKVLIFEYNLSKIKTIKQILQNGLRSITISNNNEQLTFKDDTNNYQFKSIKINDSDIKISDRIVSSDENINLYHKERMALLGDLLNTLKHELSNPLFGLKLATELLLTLSLDQNKKQFIEEIYKGINRCHKIISSFTTLYANQSHGIVNLNDVIEEVLTLTKSVTKDIQKQVINITNNCINTIYTNETSVVQILFNLILNSAQELMKLQTRSPKIFIEIGFTQTSYHIKIADNGLDIDPKIADSIFNPFYTTKEKGTGLGLYISRSLAKKLSGDLHYLPNHKYQGATFELTLPRTISPNEDTNY